MYSLTGRAGLYLLQAQESRLGFVLSWTSENNILEFLREVKVQVGFPFPSGTPGLRMNQLNTVQAPKSTAMQADPSRRHRLPPHQPARQSKRRELSAAFPPIRVPMPAADSSILRFTGLLLHACSYSNTRTSLPAAPRCRARLHRFLAALGSPRAAAQNASRRPRAELGQLTGERDAPSRKAAAATETQQGLGRPAAAQIIR